MNPKDESQGRSGDENAREQFDHNDERDRVRFVAHAASRRAVPVNVAFPGATYREVPFDTFCDRAIRAASLRRFPIGEIDSRSPLQDERARGKARGKERRRKGEAE